MNDPDNYRGISEQSRLGKGIRRWITFLLYTVSLMYICSEKKKEVILCVY